MRTILVTLLCAMTVVAADPPRRAPGFSLPDLQGSQHDLADYHGKVVLLEFMQTNCPHCAAFAGTLEKVQQKYGPKVAILSICNPPDDRQKMAAFVSGHGVKHPMLFDMGQVAYSYLKSVQFDLPQVYLIDTNGMIQRHFEYNVMTKEVFEGDGLMPEIDRLVGSAATKK